ncbi:MULTISPECIES: NAD(P) transhydrogenase subunit alpha [unclassified Microbacterium]|uniref:NAD(P) transhydrogenase subunit alpha n=1 Tax=unclassified Microbacterium TaxID=2609290 RepID=UPI00214B2176|nr:MULTISPECIES: NAD(P) transhydrogenase subunit alpha [unclassified Microbacterium]MCR2810588.1 NAD(P) transhydrogenase subunit alpha [Microbacterium sp. zg.B185]WIM18125.1 NAD(P) transhydrogenase subunit alpha [Microbacterium sp. zg-B185]
MTIHVRIRAERAPGEKRVAATPDSVKKLRAAGASVQVESGAGLGSLLTDAAYAAAGAGIVADHAAVEPGTVLLHVRPLSADETSALPAGTVTVGTLDPFQHPGSVTAARDARVTTFALDMLPRISRAQSMDVLSSQALLAGYRLVTLAADAFGRMFGMTMTAAGTLAPARVLVLGAGVAGLQAIATAKRLGAVVSANDVRAASADEVRSVGGTFIDLDLGTAEAGGGYAKELAENRARRQQELLAPHIAASDIVLTTAAVPGRAAPRLVTADMVAAMRPGSVLVDLAAESGGNIEGSVPGEWRTVPVPGGAVTLIGARDIQSDLAPDASKLYAMNCANFTALIMKDGDLMLDFDDELVSGSVVTHDGAVRNERVAASIEGVRA